MRRGRTLPRGQKNGERHKSLGFCVTPCPPWKYIFFSSLCLGEENLLVDEEILAKCSTRAELFLKLDFS